MGSEWFSPFVHAFFPFFFAFFPSFCIFPFFLRIDKGKQQQFTAKMGNFTPTPSAPTPCKTSRVFKECFWRARVLYFSLGGFTIALGGFSVEAPEPHSGPFSGRFGSDSGGLPGCNSDFWSATPTFGLTLTFGPESDSNRILPFRPCQGTACTLAGPPKHMISDFNRILTGL